jgi:hypothetical protein
MKSKLFTLKAPDWLKSIIIFFITTVITGVYQLIQASGGLTWPNIRTVLISAVGATLAYLIKNYLTNSNGQFMAKEKA